MTEYVVIPQGEDKVIYGVLGGEGEHDACMTVLSAIQYGAREPAKVFFHEAMAEASKVPTNICHSSYLVGWGWYELAPARPLPGGQPGGERQDGDCLARRFARKRADGYWAVVTRYVYLATPLGEPLDSETLAVEMTNEFVVCKDLHDPHATETFFFETYTGLPYEPNTSAVRLQAEAMSCGDIVWNGREFADNQAVRLLR